jgi:hypothetical protein
MPDTHHIRPVLGQLSDKTREDATPRPTHLHVAHRELDFGHVHEAHSQRCRDLADWARSADNLRRTELSLTR